MKLTQDRQRVLDNYTAWWAGEDIGRPIVYLGGV